MKRCFILIGFSILFFSCEFDTPTYHEYYKSFFLGDASFVMNGEIFDIVDYPNKKPDNVYFPLSEIIPIDFPICLINFYIDNRDFWQNPYYRQLRDWDPQRFYKYDYLEYMYVYVAETLTISEQRTYEHIGAPWDYTNVYHFDLNFTKPGWYKICIFDTNYNNKKFKNDAKHKTGQNTNFYL